MTPISTSGARWQAYEAMLRAAYGAIVAPPDLPAVAALLDGAGLPASDIAALLAPFSAGVTVDPQGAQVSDAALARVRERLLAPAATAPAAPPVFLPHGLVTPALRAPWRHLLHTFPDGQVGLADYVALLDVLHEQGRARGDIAILLHALTGRPLHLVAGDIDGLHKVLAVPAQAVAAMRQRLDASRIPPNKGDAS
ncbi:hypothetical protein [Pseudoduganella buxea]|uniref:Uncharacterized protein n=2 Tax=Pseudoduganella buxea TaxID=1949069 RepID=A0A6I3T6P2_9BURK|nr:hypothetical protein [Pseudoduganella buxea]MTV56416.1 hypothetical protein [Pseudoduganella buxea]